MDTFGNLSMIGIVTNYLCECFKDYPAEASLAIGIFRTVFGLTVTFFLEEWVEEVKASLPGVVKRGSVCVWDTKGRVVPIAEGIFVYVHLSYCSKLTDIHSSDNAITVYIGKYTQLATGRPPLADLKLYSLAIGHPGPPGTVSTPSPPL